MGAIIATNLPVFILGEIAGLAIALPISLFVCWFWFATGYIVGDIEIILKYGPVKKSVAIQEIKKLSKTKNPMSAPALSLDRRIEIEYGRFADFVLVSPEKEREFILLILKKNPGIELDEKIKRILND
ncbi:PH domain-containing protein [Evansella sp. LMS18]|uniref:PH domain-containing protein n=1 Tax=Evansella sp. LMS18 TaxID=2924033 RepID=UPI0020D1AC3B|nr:PH domain-containing protein [Evansella sp. LMS18]UTR10117.1 PH domain-containing protein [Evansella sp. LMS18]